MTEEGDGGTKLFQTTPYNVDAEKGVLGAIFVNNRAYEKVSEFLRPEHFAYTQHGQVFESCVDVDRAWSGRRSGDFEAPF